MDCATPYQLLSKSLSLIPFSHYLLAVTFIFFSFVYNFLEIHFFHDFITFFRGDPVLLTYSSGSQLYQSVASKCRILHGRYLPTPWLSSPHLVTAFLSFFGRAPQFSYRRHLFNTVDGGTIALDWLLHSDVMEVAKNSLDTLRTGWTGSHYISLFKYLKHLAFKMARQGWNVVVSNHRGLGGISITSDCFYNAGWTEDIRKVIDYIHCQHPEAPLFAVGTSIGANILVKYLGEDGVNTPVVGAAAVCSPWDLLICDRFINRRLVQKFYDRVLTLGLQGYAQLHQPIMSRLADWEGIKRSRSVRDFDNYATRIVGKFETVDTFYRHSSSVGFVGNVSVPLLCISALDDPVCTREAIPWDECRANENIILATTQHGGHLAFYEGITANSLWWVRAVDEFFGVLHSSSYINRRKKIQGSNLAIPSQSSIDHAPHVNVTEDGMVTAIDNIQTDNVVENITNEPMVHNKKDEDVLDTRKSNVTLKTHSKNKLIEPSKPNVNDFIAPLRRRIDQLSRQNKISIWLLAYIAIITTWPLVGSALLLFLKKRFKNVVPAVLFRR